MVFGNTGKIIPFTGGGQVNNPADIIQKAGVPPTGRTEYSLGTIYINTSTGFIYSLSGKTSTTSTWALLGSGSGAVTATSVAGATPIENNVRYGQASFTDNITAGAYATLVLTDSLISASSVIIASASCADANTACSVVEITPGSGTVSFRVFNGGASNATSNVNINFWVLN